MAKPAGSRAWAMANVHVRAGQSGLRGRQRRHGPDERARPRHRNHSQKPNFLTRHLSAPREARIESTAPVQYTINRLYYGFRRIRPDHPKKSSSSSSW